MTDIDGGFPVYILDDDTIIFLKEDIGHVEFWEQHVSLVASKKFNISRHLIKNLPYCQRRGRVVLNNFYCGEKISKKLIGNIEKTLGCKLKFVYDDHETRCPFETSSFNGLISHID